jgi:lysophospholipase L1-like esterase
MSGTALDVILEPRLGLRKSARRQRVTIGSDVPVWVDIRDDLTGALIPDATGISALYWLPGTREDESAAQPLDAVEAAPGTWQVLVPTTIPGTYVVWLAIEGPIHQTGEIVFDVSSVGQVTLTSTGTPDWGAVHAVAAAAAVSAALPEARRVGLVAGQDGARPFAEAAAGSEDRAQQSETAASGSRSLAEQAAERARSDALNIGAMATDAAIPLDTFADLPAVGVNRQLYTLLDEGRNLRWYNARPGLGTPGYVNAGVTSTRTARAFKDNPIGRYVWQLKTEIQRYVLGGLQTDGRFDMPGWSVRPWRDGLSWRSGKHTIMALDARGFRVRGWSVTLAGLARVDDTVEVARDPATDLEVATRRSSRAEAQAAANTVSAGLLKRDGTDGGMTGPLSLPGSRLGRTQLYLWAVKDRFKAVVAYLDGTRFRLPGGSWDHDGTLRPRGPVVLPGNPVLGTHAASRDYVDVAVAAGGGGGGNSAAVTRRQMAGRSGTPAAPAYTGGALDFNMRLPMRTSAEDSWTDLEFWFSNFGRDLGADAGNDLTLRLGVELVSGEVIPVLWSNGQRAMTLAPGAICGTIPLRVAVAANSSWWLRVYATVPTGGTWIPSHEVLSAAEGGAVDYGTGVDKSVSGTIPAVTISASAPITPLMVLGRPTSGGIVTAGARVGKPLVALVGVGDSIMTGQGASQINGSLAGLGYFPRGAMLAGMPWVRTARQGARFEQFDSEFERYRRAYAWVGCTHMLCNFGTNDVSANATLAMLQGYNANLAAAAASMGIKFLPITLTPRTNPTNDGYYSSDGPARWQTRLDYNAWLRTNPFGHGVFDAAAVVEDPARPGYWLGSAPPDGLHPDDPKYQVIAEALGAWLPNL